jgi:hypothetical protein
MSDLANLSMHNIILLPKGGRRLQYQRRRIFELTLGVADVRHLFTCTHARQTMLRSSSFVDVARILQPGSRQNVYVHVYFYPGRGRRQEFSEDWNSFREQAPGYANQLGTPVDDLVAGAVPSFTSTLYLTLFVL